MRYVGGFQLPVPKKNLQAYRHMAQKAGKIWREHGALEYRECAGDDLNVNGNGILSANNQAQACRDGSVRLDRIQIANRSRPVNAKVMKDPRLADSVKPKSMPFDVKRMVYSGFNVMVDES